MHLPQAAPQKAYSRMRMFIWMLQAIYDFDISYEHIAGSENGLADSLSRMLMSRAYHTKAESILIPADIHNVLPCLYVFNILQNPILSRGGVRVVPAVGGQLAISGSSHGNSQKS